MKIYSLQDPLFARYGKVIEGYDLTEALKILKMKDMPMGGVKYVAEDDELQALPLTNLLQKNFFGGLGCQFHRLVELWFDGPEEWYQAAVEGTKVLEKPDWAQQEQFPFLRSNYNIVGMFLSDMAASDNLTQYRGYITMR